MHRSIFVILIISTLYFCSCRKEYRVILKEMILADPSKQRQDTILKFPNSSSYFSRLYRPVTNGLISNFIVPNEMKDKEIKIVFRGKARTNYAHSNAVIVVSIISRDNQQISWTPLPLRYYFTETNTWCYFKDSITVKHESWQLPYYYLNTLAFLGSSQNEVFDLDSLFVEISAKDN